MDGIIQTNLLTLEYIIKWVIINNYSNDLLGLIYQEGSNTVS